MNERIHSSSGALDMKWRLLPRFLWRLGTVVVVVPILLLCASLLLLLFLVLERPRFRVLDPHLGRAVADERASRLSVLRAKSFADLAKLPDWHRERTTLLGRSVYFNVHRIIQLDGSQLVIVESFEPQFYRLGPWEFSLGGGGGGHDGFFALPTGQYRDASQYELAEWSASR
jgi:hypothetical protein